MYMYYFKVTYWYKHSFKEAAVFDDKYVIPGKIKIFQYWNKQINLLLFCF